MFLERMRTRELIVLLLSLVLLILAFELFNSRAPSGISKSSEAGFVSHSPRGVLGGAVIPASCESGYEHYSGECPSPTPRGSCASGFWLVSNNSFQEDWATLTINLNKTNYSPGESIIASGAVSVPPRGQSGDVELYVMNSGLGPYLSLFDLSVPSNYSSSGSVSFPAPSTGGSYAVDFFAQAQIIDNLSDGSIGSLSCSIPYTVPTVNLYFGTQ